MFIWPFKNMFLYSWKKLNLPFIFAESIALEITQKIASWTNFSVWSVLGYCWHCLWYFLCKLTVYMQGRLCYLLLTGCGLEWFFVFFSLTVLVSGHMKHIPHTFLSSKLQEHMEVQLRIGAEHGFVLIKRTCSYTRKWEKRIVCNYFNRQKPQIQPQKIYIGPVDQRKSARANPYSQLFPLEIVNRRGCLDSPNTIWKNNNL